MKHYCVEGATLPEAYHRGLVTLAEEGLVYPCPDYDTTMKEISLTFVAENALAEPRVSRLYPGGFYELQQYKMEILDGILDFMIGAAENTWEYTYHDRFVRQLPFIIEELKRNPWSRRASVNIRDFDVDSANEHPACLQHMAFYIREDKLHMKVLMRSNDAVQATFMNAFAFVALQEKVAAAVGVPVGSYTHTAYSFHAYANSFATLDHYVERIKNGSAAELTYPYEGCFDALMADSIPEIMAMVRTQKDKYGVE